MDACGSKVENNLRPNVFIVRRLGSTPRERGSTSSMSCPDVFLLSDGRVGCVGTDMTEELESKLPDGASIAPNERLVALPLRTMQDAIPDILQAATITQG